MAHSRPSIASLVDPGQIAGADASMGRLEAKQEQAVGIMEPMVVVSFLRHLMACRCTYHRINQNCVFTLDSVRADVQVPALGETHTGRCAAG